MKWGKTKTTLMAVASDVRHFTPEIILFYYGI